MAFCESAWAATASAVALPLIWSACLPPICNAIPACHPNSYRIWLNNQDVLMENSEPTSRRAASAAGLHTQEHPRQHEQHPSVLHGCRASDGRFK
jgi:hypothetical protein